ncbi:MAG TPA: YjjG family noncanonical pyrimidine nucleotidase [Bellilinea sp.]|nr:YjjG family noncanonical pyrimidine nucleotidase [Bellilinea sp.]
MCYPFLCFDADHTLYNFVDAEQESINAAFADFGYPFNPEYFPLYHRLNMEVWHQYALGQFPQSRIESLRMERLLAHLGYSLDPQTFSDVFLAHMARLDKPEPHAVETLRTLSAEHTIAVLTNGLTLLQRPRMEQAAFKPYIHHHIIAQELGVSKPHAEYFAKAMEIIGCEDPGTALMIGDSLSSDIGGALNFGMDACWYNPHGLENTSPHKPTYEIRDLSKLLAIV